MPSASVRALDQRWYASVQDYWDSQLLLDREIAPHSAIRGAGPPRGCLSRQVAGGPQPLDLVEMHKVATASP